MGLADYEVFIRERLRAWDETLDLSEGSPVDTKVIQPLLRRLGTDPFTVDASTFIIERLTQEFPDLATTDGDAVSDLLMKPALLLWDPIIREIQRVKNMLSFRDPATLTLDEAEALGANLFSERDRGNVARGVVRIYFGQAQNASVSPANFVTSRSGLHYFPDGNQSIRLEEMLLNGEGELYYFDINVVAERAGDEYNIGPNEIVTIANFPAAIRVVNKNRFRFGLPEEDAVAFASRIRNDLSERSLVTLRGINAKLNRAFPEVTRLAVVGFNDPEMQRDVITGGSLGDILLAGTDATTVPDGEFKPTSRRVTFPSGGFIAKVGPVGPSSGYVLTLFDMFGPNPPTVRDLAITRVINDQTVEVADQVLMPAQNKPWCLRRVELTLSGLPGGIVFPEGVNGTVTVEPNKVHIGGCTDILVRGADFDTAVTVIDVVTDDDPLLSGTRCRLDTPDANSDGILGDVILADYELGANYQVGDAVYVALERARREQFTFEILDGVAAGVYRVLKVTQSSGNNPILTLTPPPLTPVGDFRWRLLDDIEIDLVEPKETRISGSTGQVVQDQDLFSTTPPIDFDALGVSVGDILRISNGSVVGDYVVEEVPAPFFTQVRVDRNFTATQSGLEFTIFRRNGGGGVTRPLIRVTSIDLLDSAAQPVGTTIPYAKAVEVRSRAFQNPGIGLKVTSAVCSLGIVSVAEPTGGFDFDTGFGVGGTISFTWDGGPTITTYFPPGPINAFDARDFFNAASQIEVNQDICQVISYNGQRYLGFVPLGPNMRTTAPSTAHSVLFVDDTVRTTRDIRTPDVPDWNDVTPTIDPDLDVVWVLDGFQTGFYSDLERNYSPPSLNKSTALRVSHDFAPEIFRSIRVGARSLGSARMYFLEPTSVEVDHTTRFQIKREDGSTLSFKPDPTLRFQRIPAPPNGTKPKNGVTSSNKLQSNGIDFVSKGILAGDIVTIDYVPITGSQDLADPVPNLALKSLRISLDNQPDKILTFVNDVATPGAVSRDGVAKQINNLVGLNIASIVEVSAGQFRLRFNPEILMILRQQPGSSAEANTTLGFSNVADTNNVSADAGEYLISEVAPGGNVDTLEVTTMTGNSVTFSGVSDQQFKVFRRGGQRIISTQMAQNVAEAGLYYFDVELVSEGVGDLWNIDAGILMLPESYKSDGYYLSTPDTNLAFSPAEKVVLHLSRSILEVGVDDDPENATQLTGQSISINYEYSALVENVQSFISADTERVINQSPLARHLVPHFVRFDLEYFGGSKETEVLPDLQRYIREIQPSDAMEASDLQRIVSNRGATSIQNPINMLAVVHNYDRSITLARSQNALTTGRLAAFVPDRIVLTRRVAG
jgi:hypothetical protein